MINSNKGSTTIFGTGVEILEDLCCIVQGVKKAKISTGMAEELANEKIMKIVQRALKSDLTDVEGHDREDDPIHRAVDNLFKELFRSGRKE